MSDRAMQQWTPEAWERARKILCGESKKKISWAAAARAAKVTVPTLKAWIKRSKEKRPEDDPLIHSMAEDIEDIDSLRAGYLEDTAWRRAMEGEIKPVFYMGARIDNNKVRTVDNKLLMRMLERYDPEYQRNKPAVLIPLDDVTEIYQRLVAGKRVAEAEHAAQLDAPNTVTLPESDYSVFDVK